MGRACTLQAFFQQPCLSPSIAVTVSVTVILGITSQSSVHPSPSPSSTLTRDITVRYLPPKQQQRAQIHPPLLAHGSVLAAALGPDPDLRHRESVHRLQRVVATTVQSGTTQHGTELSFCPPHATAVSRRACAHDETRRKGSTVPRTHRREQPLGRRGQARLTCSQEKQETPSPQRGPESREGRWS